MKLRTLSVALLGLAASSNAFADTLGFRVGAGSWDHEPSGTIRYDSGSVGTNADLKNDLNLQDDKEGYLYAIVEHPVPLIPNVKVMQTGLTSTGSGTINTSFTYGGQTYNASESITSELVLDHTDFTLFWQILDNVVSLDLGLTAKAVDAKATLIQTTGSTKTVTNSFDGIVPMGYVAVGVSPTDSLEFRVEGNMLEVGDSSLTDYTAKVSYTTDYMLGIEAGIRSLELELDDLDSVYSNMKFEGPFVGLYLQF